MLKNEARWLGRALAVIPDGDLFPMVNVGSSTRALREEAQPWIHEEIFKPLSLRGGRVVHQDLKAADGVDLVGDLNDPACWEKVSALAPRSVFCSNVLEHVPVAARDALCARMVALVPPGGYLVLSVPRAFPYHPDPLDTGFRPSPDDLAQLFPGTTRTREDVVNCGTVWGLLDRNGWRLAGKVGRMVWSTAGRTPPAEGGSGERGATLREWLVPWAWREFRATCILLRKQ
ncbi:MAG: methyltransferase type 11 [Deltaproteobacteria bacterium]|nr:methyltransferase type 11 [Deltaproteobacteria bacterium]